MTAAAQTLVHPSRKVGFWALVVVLMFVYYLASTYASDITKAVLDHAVRTFTNPAFVADTGVWMRLTNGIVLIAMVGALMVATAIFLPGWPTSVVGVAVAAAALVQLAVLSTFFKSIKAIPNEPVVNEQALGYLAALAGNAVVTVLVLAAALALLRGDRSLVVAGWLAVGVAGAIVAVVRVSDNVELPAAPVTYTVTGTYLGDPAAKAGADATVVFVVPTRDADGRVTGATQKVHAITLAATPPCEKDKDCHVPINVKRTGDDALIAALLADEALAVNTTIIGPQEADSPAQSNVP